MKLFKHFTDITHGVRRLGAAAIDICHVACGKADVYWEYDIKPWDIAAGILIAKEAGCIVSDLSGNDTVYIKGSLPQSQFGGTLSNNTKNLFSSKCKHLFLLV